MAVSGLMEVSLSTMKGGKPGISGQRGTEVWGANYLYSPSGLQNDIYTISNVFSGLITGGALSSPVLTTPTVVTSITPSVSGALTIGSVAKPMAVSGIYMKASDGSTMRLVIMAGGLVSGVAA